jgi:RecB family exonuclease
MGVMRWEVVDWGVFAENCLSVREEGSRRRENPIAWRRSRRSRLPELGPVSHSPEQARLFPALQRDRHRHGGQSAQPILHVELSAIVQASHPDPVL